MRKSDILIDLFLEGLKSGQKIIDGDKKIVILPDGNQVFLREIPMFTEDGSYITMDMDVPLFGIGDFQSVEPLIHAQYKELESKFNSPIDKPQFAYRD